SGNQIQHLHAIAGMRHLTELNAESNQIYDLEPLASLTQLKSLQLANNRVWDLSPIAGLSFTRGDVTNTITDITASVSFGANMQ
ncbi:leucine-rich repeat domain-containing protein, partial [Enterococcus faecium]|uniref:leucine-rich repeat domain-containing protein n=1 Tax=Enterococcus faecium TaxID=1352 RepID=UPI0021D60CE8